MKRLRMAFHGGAAPLKLLFAGPGSRSYNLGETMYLGISVEGGVPPFSYFLAFPYVNSTRRVFASKTDARQASTAEPISAGIANSFWTLGCTDALGNTVQQIDQVSVSYPPAYVSAWASASQLASGEGCYLQWSSDLGNPTSPISYAWYMRKNGGGWGFIGAGNYFTMPAADAAGTTYDFYVAVSNPRGATNSGTFRITKR